MAPPSRWTDDDADAAADSKARKEAKEARKRAKLEKAQQAIAAVEQADQRPVKRRKPNDEDDGEGSTRPLLRFATPGWGPCRSVNNYETLNAIEEGSYGWVSRAQELGTGTVVALKKLKMDNSAVEGFPVTALREIGCLSQCRHPHIVPLREIVTDPGPGDIYLVLDFIEHDLRTLSHEMAEPFLPSETKTIMLQLSSAVAYLHAHWIFHRDLKTSNILMNNRGEIKIADFGMARSVGDPPPANLTQLVVTLWYRAPELLLGTDKYDGAIDVWSLGCIFGELITKTPILQGSSEVDQLAQTFNLIGLPSEESWPGFRKLPNAKSLRLPTKSKPGGGALQKTFPTLTTSGLSLLSSLLSLNPASRPTASHIAEQSYFMEKPLPKPAALFPSFPSRAGQVRKRRPATPSAPRRGERAPALDGEGLDLSKLFETEKEEEGAGFSLRLG